MQRGQQLIINRKTTIQYPQHKPGRSLLDEKKGGEARGSIRFFHFQNPAQLQVCARSEGCLGGAAGGGRWS